MTYNKTQFQKMLRKIYDQVEDVRMLLEEESESIEPYEGKDELTQAQEERQEWLDNAQITCQDFLDNIEEFIW